MIVSRETIQTIFEGRDRVTQTARRVKSSLDEVAQSYSRAERAGTTFGRSTLGVGLSLTGAVAGFLALTQAGASTADELGKAAAQMGVASEGLQAIQRAAGFAGVGVESINSSVQRFLIRLSEAASTGGLAARSIEELGLSTEELRRVDPAEAFARVAGALNSVQDAGDRVRLARDLFGRQGVAAVNLTAEAIRESAAELRRFGIAFTELSVARIEVANDQFSRLGGLVRDSAVLVRSGLSPALVAVTETILEFAGALGGAETAGEILGRKLITAIGAIGDGFVFLRDVPVEAFRAALGAIAVPAARLGGLFRNIQIRATQSGDEQKRSLLQLKLELGEVEAAAIDARVALQSTLSGEDSFSSRLNENFSNALAQTEAAARERVRTLRNLAGTASAGASGGEGAGVGGGGLLPSAAPPVPTQAELQQQTRDLRATYDEWFGIQEDYRNRLNDFVELNDQTIISPVVREQIIGGIEQQRDIAVAAYFQAQQDIQNELRQATSDAQSFSALFGIDVDTASVQDIATALQTEVAESLAAVSLGSSEGAAAEQQAAATQIADSLRGAVQSRLSQNPIQPLAALDVTQFGTDLDRGLETISDAFRERFREINSNDLLPPQARADAVTQALALRDELSEALRTEVQATVRVRTVTDTVTGGLDTAGQFGSAIGEIQQARLREQTETLRTRAQEIAQIRESLQSAIQNSDQAEIDSYRSRLTQLTSLQKKEDEQGRRLFERNKRVQIATTVVNTISAAIKAFNQGGGWPTGLIPLAATLATGYAQVRNIRSQQYQSQSGGFSGAGSGGGTAGNLANNSNIASAPNINAQQLRPVDQTQQPIIRREVVVSLPGGSRLTTEELVQLHEDLQDLEEDNVITNYSYRVAS